MITTAEILLHAAHYDLRLASQCHGTLKTHPSPDRLRSDVWGYLYSGSKVSICVPHKSR